MPCDSVMMMPLPWSHAITEASPSLWLPAYRGVQTADGTAVTHWLSRNGTPSDFAPPSAGARPALTANVADGYPSVLFGGADDGLKCDGPPLSGTSGHVFAVVKLVAATDGSVVCGSDAAGVAENLRLGVTASGFPYIITNHSGATNAVNGQSVIGTSAPRIIEYKSSGTAWSIVMDGVSQTLTTTGLNTGDWFGDITGIDNVSIGYRADSSPSKWLNGHVLEVVAFDTVIADSVARKVRKALAKQYGVSL